LKEESEIIKGKILSECGKNSMKLDSVLIQNQSFMNYLDSLSYLDRIEGFGFNFSSELLASSSWKIAQTSSAIHLIDQNFLDDATEMYEVQQYYMNISNQMFQNLGDMLMKVDLVEPKIMVMTSHYYLSNILVASKQLQENYKDFLSKYADGNTIQND
ncbi:MAG: hypothetical protein RJQ14_17555, partial [Marinoscillum sp.]